MGKIGYIGLGTEKNYRYKLKVKLLITILRGWHEACSYKSMKQNTKQLELGRCFACGKQLHHTVYEVYTLDDQRPWVGIVCYRKIKQAGEEGYLPPLGGPRLFLHI